MRKAGRILVYNSVVTTSPSGYPATPQECMERLAVTRDEIRARLSFHSGHPSVDAEALRDWCNALSPREYDLCVEVLKEWIQSSDSEPMDKALWFMVWVAPLLDLESALLELAGIESSN